MVATISHEDVQFLISIGFTEDIPDAVAIEDGALNFYFMEVKDHPFIENLNISINIEPGCIEVYGKDEFTPFITKPFTRENILSVLKFLGIEVLNRN